MVEISTLTINQARLLETLVRADQALPREERHGFRAPATPDGKPLTLYHLGLPTYGFEVSPADAYALADAGLVTILQSFSGNVLRIDITRRGFEAVDRPDRRSA